MPVTAPPPPGFFLNSSVAILAPDFILSYFQSDIWQVVYVGIVFNMRSDKGTSKDGGFYCSYFGRVGT